MFIISMKRLHYISGVTLALFTLIHLANHLLGLWGINAYTEFMHAARTIYRNPVIEFVLLLAVFLQLSSGITLIRKRTKRTNMSRAERLRVYSGIYLAFFLVVHVFVVLFYRGKGIDTNFYFACLGFNIFPVVFIFIPYYGAGIMSVFIHLGVVHYYKMQQFVSLAKAKKQAISVIVAGSIITILSILSYSNYFRGVPFTKEHMDLARLLFKPFM